MIDGITCWNVGPRPTWRWMRSLGRLRRDHPSEVTGLFEATRGCLAVRARYGARNRVIRRRSDVVAVVSRSLPKPRVEVIRHDVEWVGPKLGLPKRGRRHLLLDFDGDGVLLLHRVTGGPGGPNRAAWYAEADLIAEVCRRPGLRTLRVLGDQNARAVEVAGFWKELGMRQIRTGCKVDHGAQRGVATWGVRLDPYGSDHPAVRYEGA